MSDTLPQRNVAAFLRRAHKIGLDAHVIERWINAHGESYSMRVVNGNAWDARWIVARCGDFSLTRDGAVYSDTMELMNLHPSFKSALMRRYMGDK